MQADADVQVIVVRAVLAVAWQDVLVTAEEAAPDVVADRKRQQEKPFVIALGARSRWL